VTPLPGEQRPGEAAPREEETYPFGV
jgi:hypothetical protein